jgi:hypothetical protein
MKLNCVCGGFGEIILISSLVVSVSCVVCWIKSKIKHKNCNCECHSEKGEKDAHKKY